MSTSHVIRASAAITIGIVGALLILQSWQLPPFHGSVETTENAYVRGKVTTLSPQVTGYVVAVNARDYQNVHAGDVIVQIDDRIYRQKLKQAEATLAMKRAALQNSEQSQRAAEARIRSSEAQVTSANAALDVARSNAERVEALLPRGATTQSAADQAHGTLAQAQATLHQAESAVDVARQDLQSIIVNRDSLKAEIDNAVAAVELAKIDLANTHIVAPADGQLGEVGARLGQYVSVGTQLAALVPEQVWVVANFKETQLSGMKIGQPVTFTVDALQGETLTGHIEQFSPAAGSEFAVLKADNATGNFTKVTQRLPVRIAIDPGQPLTKRLAPGMSVVVSVDTATKAAAAATPASPQPADPDHAPAGKPVAERRSS
ncbi:HlyD family secretion protein [Chelatococcus asaccharovorans]|uniref:Multidrug resistance efflux pump n=1 Tax=Chelatococcus asaccharovorans TaxID=28210 RepID=A0A2V3U4W8_9HYPH|nr:HlyD family secretion protein [Chelatococcus asaccharovorans]MBS7706103.1 HlyD family secretion protein [Chelatococcus asaccharovorans]PXW52472.1 multidrug resistance efflux pump [Chelatococcus asaccharovorans]